MKWNKLAPGVIAILAIIDGGLVIHHGTVRGKIPSAKTECSRLAKAVGKQRYSLKHPVIRKTIPSAYKKMMDDGKQVEKAEDKLINLTYQSHKHHKKTDRKSTPYRNAHKVLQNYVANTGSTDDNITYDIWTSHLKDTVKLIPGSGEPSGNYECAFLISDKKGHIDNVITATYQPSAHMFTDFIVYGSYSVSDVENPSSSKKNNQKRPKNKHISKKRAKKIVQKHNNPKQKRGAKK